MIGSVQVQCIVTIWRCKCFMFQTLPIWKYVKQAFENPCHSHFKYRYESKFHFGVFFSLAFQLKNLFHRFIYRSGTVDVTSINSYVCINFANPKRIHWDYCDEKITTCRGIHPTSTLRRRIYHIHEMFASIFILVSNKSFWLAKSSQFMNQPVYNPEIMCGKVFFWFKLTVYMHTNQFIIINMCVCLTCWFEQH